jgi:hypothetical protein
METEPAPHLDETVGPDVAEVLPIRLPVARCRK